MLITRSRGAPGITASIVSRVLSPAAEIGLTGEALAGLRHRLRGPLLTPADADYEVARRTWNHRVDRFPGAIARCRDRFDWRGSGRAAPSTAGAAPDACRC